MDARVCVAGVTGWTGRAVAEGVLGSEDLRLVAGLAREAAGRDVGTALGRDTPVGVEVTADPARALAHAPTSGSTTRIPRR
jgi:4-hydroxy-tetrahydrodipicolinate reductase